MDYKIEHADEREYWLAEQLVCGEGDTRWPDLSPEEAFVAFAPSASGTHYLVARGNGQLHAAVALEQRAPGLTSIGLPSVGSAPAELRAELLREAVKQTSGDARGQVLMLEPGDVALANLAVELGFQRVAEIAFEECVLRRDGGSPSTELALQPAGAAELTPIVDLTLSDSRDCPLLHPVLGATEMMSGFGQRAAPEHRAWYRIAVGDAIVGCLLMNETRTDVMELAYMGVIPSARGHGFGAAMVGAAQQVAFERGCLRLLLAVDLANTPALTLYDAAGFVELGTRVLWLRIVPTGLNSG